MRVIGSPSHPSHNQQQADAHHPLHNEYLTGCPVPTGWIIVICILTAVGLYVGGGTMCTTTASTPPFTLCRRERFSSRSLLLLRAVPPAASTRCPLRWSSFNGCVVGWLAAGCESAPAVAVRLLLVLLVLLQTTTSSSARPARRPSPSSSSGATSVRAPPPPHNPLFSPTKRQSKPCL